jgi:archaellum biogenesis ATPase FlaH
MSENKNSIATYLGTDFQLKLLWQLVTESSFCEKILPYLEIGYFDDHNYKRFFIVIKEYYDKYKKVPNLQNKSINHAIKEFQLDNEIDYEQLIGVLKPISNWQEACVNGVLMFDGDAIQKQTWHFIKQQEYKKLANEIIEKLVRNKLDKNVHEIEERIRKISEVGVEDDDAVEIFDNIDMALRKEFREPIPTGVKVLDEATGGGLGRGEIGIILAPTGAGKTTILTKFANHAFNSGKNVLQLIFEDTPDQVRRKHFTIWSKVPLSEIDERTEEVTKCVEQKHQEVQSEFNNKLIIKRFSQENTTLPMIKDYVVRFQKKYGYKFDIIILDYIDCVDSHKKGSDTNADELAIIKSFEAMAAEFNIPCWTAIQTNRSGIESELVYINHMGGNIKRAQKSHFLMSIARTQEQKFHNLANLQILKARFAKDGYVFKDCIFNNNTLEIEGTGDMVKTKSSSDEFKKNEPEYFNEKMKKRDGKEDKEDVLKNVTKVVELQGEINLDSLDDELHDNDKFQKELQKKREESLKKLNSDENEENS